MHCDNHAPCRAHVCKAAPIALDGVRELQFKIGINSRLLTRVNTEVLADMSRATGCWRWPARILTILRWLGSAMFKLVAAASHAPHACSYELCPMPWLHCCTGARTACNHTRTMIALQIGHSCRYRASRRPFVTALSGSRLPMRHAHMRCTGRL